MKYVRRDLGEAAEVNSGGGLPGFAREGLKLAALCVLLFACLYFGVGLATDLVLKRLTPQQEQALFAPFELIDATPEIPAHQAATWALAESTLERLRADPRVPPITYRLLYLPDPQPNAFALPGGAIALTSGLLDGLAGEPIGLAFVLAHELGHFAHRDHLGGLGRRIGWSLGLRILFGGELDALTQRSSEFAFLHYSRGQESAADTFGLALIESVYGDTSGAERLFELLAENSEPPRWAYMFSTHPDARERIRDLSQGNP